MDTSAFDIGPTTGSALQPVLDIAKTVEDTEESIEALSSALANAKSRLHNLRTVVLPDKMAELGIEGFSDEDGNQVLVEPLVAGTLPKDPNKRASAIRYLEGIGGGSLLKTKVLMEFGRDDRDYASALADRLELEGQPVRTEEFVHPQTLLAFVRERLASGEAINSDSLGVFVGKIAKIKRAKIKRAKP